jgi:hypothetical protein
VFRKRNAAVRKTFLNYSRSRVPYIYCPPGLFFISQGFFFSPPCTYNIMSARDGIYHNNIIICTDRRPWPPPPPPPPPPCNLVFVCRCVYNITIIYVYNKIMWSHIQCVCVCVCVLRVIHVRQKALRFYSNIIIEHVTPHSSIEHVGISGRTIFISVDLYNTFRFLDLWFYQSKTKWFRSTCDHPYRRRLIRTDRQTTQPQYFWELPTYILQSYKSRAWTFL